MRLADISVITPTCDRPVGIALAERWMAAQTVQPREWIVADGGVTAASLTLGQQHLRLAFTPTGPLNFLRNLHAALTQAVGATLVFWEDDDYYAPNHLERMEAVLQSNFRALSAGDEVARYYHVGARRWKAIYGSSPALAQTAIRGLVRRACLHTVEHCIEQARSDVDTAWWATLTASDKAIAHTRTVVGIKGLPGPLGLGIGYPMHGRDWKDDPTGVQLDTWVGEAAAAYRPFALPRGEQSA